MAKFAAIAAATEDGVFSIMPRAASCSPRCATGRAVSQSGLCIGPYSADFEHAFDFDSGIHRQGSDADGCARVPALFTERRDHEIGGAVHDFRAVDEIWLAVDEAAEADHACHF